MTKAIVIIGTIYGIYRLIALINQQRKCPEDIVLRDVVLGIEKKNTATYDRVIRHLGISEKCQDRAREIGSE